MTDRYLTTDEVAELLRTSAATVRYWRQVGRGPQGFRSGRRILYAESAVQTYIDAQAAADSPSPTNVA